MRQIMNIKRNTVLAATLTTLLCAGITAGCTSPQQEARDTAREFLAAAQEGNQATVAQVLTSKARENVGTSMSVVRDEHHKGSSQGFTVGEGEVSGDTARIPVTFTDEDGTNDADVRLRREEGRWRVYGVELKSGFGPTLNVDFERPENTLGEAFRTAGQTLGVLARGLEQGAKSFESGFSEGYSEAKKDTPHSGDSVGKHGGATIEEVPSPPVRADR